MSFNYEEMNGISFQKLAQALIVADYPETQCLPVPQPDGGRDAFFYENASDKTDAIIFQVKFSNNPKAKNERDAISEAIKSEKDKVEKLIEMGAKTFILITNISGTAHLEVGSIDKINKELSKEFGIPSYVWWRDDIDARINKNSDVKWSFPEIIKGSDVLQALMESDLFKPDLEATRAFTAYIAKQKGADEELKFKQVDLTNKITQVFVDLPIGKKSKSSGKQTEEIFLFRDRYFDELFDGERHEYRENPHKHGGLAAAFLLNSPYKNGVTRIVLEGAPGQGKSTVTQFLCQVNRLRILPNQKYVLNSIKPIHNSAQTRSPFRVDLRDFAAWVTGKHPFAKSGEHVAPAEGQRSLESFLIMQINWNSGGLKVCTNDLLEFLMHANSLIVLDGFDEVAAIDTRKRVVEEINEAADRLDAQAKSLQIIVTSRPVAFANSPGFLEDKWMHLELKDLNPDNIDEYREKWSIAHRLNSAEKVDLVQVLKEKLEQPHLKELARNPMQLAILLQLMHMQGSALPDKRTALYEEYMKIFLNREVEKKQIRANDRQLILELHGFLAWLLQTQAEKGESSGSITLETLRVEVRDYLLREEHNTDLGEELLKSSVERVGALVSRVQGTFEFEVQPLREFFAARHLHKTAPYSPVGRTVSGAKPDRFFALSSSFYWTNVTRFFCGFYDKGELASLVEGIEQLSEDENYKLINHPRRLALMLLSDYVFSESPRTMRKLLELVSQQPGFTRFISTDRGQMMQAMSLPETGGRGLFFDICAEKLTKETVSYRRSQLRRVMGCNANLEDRKKYWFEQREAKLLKCHPHTCAVQLRVSHAFEDDEIIDLYKDDLETQLTWFMRASKWENILGNVELYTLAKEKFFNGRLAQNLSYDVEDRKYSGIEVLSGLLVPHILKELFSFNPEESTLLAISQFGYIPHKAQVRNLDDLDDLGIRVLKFFESYGEIKAWQQQLTPWKKLVDMGLEHSPGSNLFATISLTSLQVPIQYLEEDLVDLKLLCEGPNAVSSDDWFAPNPGLVDRVNYARTKTNDFNWWRKHYCPDNSLNFNIYICALLKLASQSVITEFLDLLEEHIEKLSPEDWQLLTQNNLRSSFQNENNDQVSWFSDCGVQSYRLLYLLAIRMKTNTNGQELGRICFGNYSGGDSRILRTAFNWEINLNNENSNEVDWDYFSKLSKLLVINDCDAGSYSRNFLSIPVPIATDILKHANEHSSMAIYYSERAASNASSQSAKIVSDVADDEDWFAVS